MLDHLKRKQGSRKPRRRVGRGVGSGLGKTSGRGQKGAGARSGTKHRAWYEGGQMPLVRRLPKRGFRPQDRLPYQVVNVKDLARFEAGSALDAAALASAGLVPRADRPVKILGEGELAVAVRVRADAASAAARRKIEAAGGAVDVARRKRHGRGVTTS
jgi:large subunit ribosomal protein L15